MRPFRTVLLGAFALASLSGCRSSGGAHAHMWPSGDVPVDLAEANDLDAAIDAMWAIPAHQRSAARTAIANELLHELRDHTAANNGAQAAETLFQLAGLWSDDIPAFSKEQQASVGAIQATKRLVAQSGDMPASMLALALLIQLEPNRAGEHRQEIREILDYADLTAVAEAGETAQRSRSLQVLEPVVRGFPHEELTDTWVARMIERQGFVEAMLNSQKASFELVRAHGGVLTTARRVATTMARAGQGKQIAKRIAPVRGIGSDRDLANLAAAFAASGATDADMAAFAEALLVGGKDGRDADPLAALRLCETTGTPARCAALADAAGRIDQPLAWLGNASDAQATLQANLRAQQISRLALLGRPLAAQKSLAAFAASKPSRELLASVHTAVGRGLLAVGEVERGEAELRRSLGLDPSNHDTVEALADLELRRGHGQAALTLIQAALTKLDDARLTNYPRAKLLAMAGDAGRIAQLDRDQTVRWYQDSIRAWEALAEGSKLPARLQAESALSVGRSRWFLGDIEPAVALIVDAGDRDPSNATIAAQSQGFLLLANRPNEALDVFLRAVREHGVGDYYRTLMALWLKLDAQQRGTTVDPTVTRVLRTMAQANRRWHEQLAAHLEAKTAAPTALASVATTRERAVELTFYRATLVGPLDFPALRQVSAAALPSLLETDFANALLGHNPLSVGIAPARSAGQGKLR